MSVNHSPTSLDASDHREPFFGPSLLLAGICILVRMAILARTSSTAEDFLITLRFAENIAEGRGFTYNPGEPVLGTTTPLYCLILAAVHWLGGNAEHFGKLTNIVADGATCIFLYRLARAIYKPELGPVAAALYAVSPPNITWAVSGMETALVTFAGVAAFTALAEKRPKTCAFWCGVLTLLRVDGLLLVAVAAVTLVRQDCRQAGRALAIYLLLVAPWMTYATLAFGSPVPSSLIAKLTVYQWRNPGFPNLIPWVTQMAGGPRNMAVAAGFLAGAWLVMRRSELSPLRPALCWLAVYYALLATSKGFLFGWYFIPPTPFYLLTAVLGWQAIALLLTVREGKPNEPGSGQGPRCRTLHVAAAFVVLLAGFAWMPRVVRDLDEAQRAEERLRKPIGLELRLLVRPGETLMLEPIGYIGYYSRARVLDSIGLVSPEVLPLYRDEIDSPLAEIVSRFRPEWVLLRTGELEQVQRATGGVHALFHDYVVVRQYRPPGVSPDTPASFTLFQRRR